MPRDRGRISYRTERRACTGLAEFVKEPSYGGALAHVVIASQGRARFLPSQAVANTADSARASRALGPACCLLLAAVFAVAGCNPAATAPDQGAAEAGVGDAPSIDQVVDLDGNPVDPLRDDCRLLVLIFAATECPISNRYAPEIERLREEFAEQGVRFRTVYPDPEETLSELRRHAADYRYAQDAVWDPQQQLVELAGATVTPEAAVLDLSVGHRLIYRGRIDNWYVDFGKSRARPTQHDLQDALRAALAGSGASATFTKAVGCYIPEPRQ